MTTKEKMHSGVLYLAGEEALLQKQVLYLDRLYDFNHTFARIWYENGGDVVQLSKVLGHTTLRMSEHYMQVYANSVKERFIENNPIESLTRSGPRKNVQRND